MEEDRGQQRHLRAARVCSCCQPCSVLPRLLRRRSCAPRLVVQRDGAPWSQPAARDVLERVVQHLLHAAARGRTQASRPSALEQQTALHSVACVTQRARLVVVIVLLRRADNIRLRRGHKGRVHGAAARHGGGQRRAAPPPACATHEERCPPARASQLYVCVLSSSLWVQEEARAGLLWQNDRGAVVPIGHRARKTQARRRRVSGVRQLPMRSARSR